MLAGRSQKLLDLSSLRSRKESAALHGDEIGRTLASKMKKLPTTIDVDLQHGSAANPAGRNRRLAVDDPSWVPLGDTIYGEIAGDYFGGAVAFSANGERFVVGAKFHDGNFPNAGYARIFDWNGTAWNQFGDSFDGEAPGGQFGYAVAMSEDGKRFAIGAPTSGESPNAGYVRIYDWTDGVGWEQLGKNIDGVASDDYFGRSVAMSEDGKRVAIGAHFYDGEAGVNAGQVRIYRYTKSAWEQLGDAIEGEVDGDYFGFSVAMSKEGGRVAIGATGTDENGFGAGHVRIYDWTETIWEQRGDTIRGETVLDRFGSGVAMSKEGSRVAIGAIGHDGSAGHVRIYDWNTTATNWIQVGADIDGEVADDNSGWTIAMSKDGERVAIGARTNDGKASDAGHVRIYDWNTTAWVQVGIDIDGEVADDNFGIAVAMSSDGSRVVVGAPGGGTGSVHVYEFPIQIQVCLADNALLPQWTVVSFEEVLD